MDNLPAFPPVFGPSSSSNQNVPNHDEMVMLNLQNPDSGLPQLPPVDPNLCNFAITPPSPSSQFSDFSSIYNYQQYNPSDDSGLPQLPSVDPNLSNLVINPSPLSEISDFSYPYDPSNDPYFWNNVNTYDDQQPIGNVDASSSDKYSQENFLNCSSICSQNFGVENIFQFPDSMRPVPASNDMCSCCIVLREFNHVKGKQFQYLELHGQIGIVSHAILDRFSIDDISPEKHNPLMFNFCSVDLDTVQKFLLNYLKSCEKDGYEIHQDELASFYQTVTVGLDEIEMTSAPLGSGDQHTGQQGFVTDEARLGNDRGKEILLASQTNAASSNTTKQGRTTFLAAQRKRTGKLSLNDFSDYFDLPLNQVAKIMNVCPTVIKRKCRLAGLSRWPYRKIKGLKRRISNKKDEMRHCTFAERPNLMAELRSMEEELSILLRKSSNCLNGELT